MQRTSQSRPTRTKAHPRTKASPRSTVHLLALPTCMVERLLLYLDVATIQRLAATCRLLHQLVHDRFITCLQVPFDRAFIEVKPFL